MSNDSETLLDLQEEVNTLGLGRIGLNEINSSKFNFATISKTVDDIQYIEYWILANAYYDEDLERFIKQDTTATSFGIQIQAKGTYPGEAEFDTKNTGVNIWRNPPKADVYKDTNTYDYTDWTDNNYIGAERLSDNEWVEFGISSGWSNNLMTDSYGGITVGGNGIEIDGAGMPPFARVTNSSFNDGTNTYYILGMLDNAYHPNGTTWECDSNEHGAWFFGFKYPQTNGAKDSENGKFVVLYNDMSSIDSSSQGYTIEDMTISDWKTILEVSSSSAKAMVNGVLTTLGGGGSSFDLIDSITDGDTLHAVTPNAVYDALLTKDITLTKQAIAETGYSATYVLSQGGTQISPKINIPKDFLVKSGSVKTCTTNDDPVEGYLVGDKYLDFVINVDSAAHATDSHIYLKVTELVDIYNADNVTLELSSSNVFSIKDGGVTFAKLASAAVGDSSSTSSSQLVLCSDTRLSDERTPTSHSHGNIDNNGVLKMNGTAQASMNVVTDGSGNIIAEAKPSIPTVVDTVVDGNSNAVTSNAVYDYVNSIIGDIDTWLVS